MFGFVKQVGMVCTMYTVSPLSPQLTSKTNKQPKQLESHTFIHLFLYFILELQALPPLPTIKSFQNTT